MVFHQKLLSKKKYGVEKFRIFEFSAEAAAEAAALL